MQDDNTQSPAEQTTETFWTWGTKALVALNIIFLLIIICGLLAVFAGLSPRFYHYILDILASL